MDFTIIQGLFGKQIENLLESLGGDAKQVTSNRILEYIVEEYNRNLEIKTLIHRNGVKLLDIYVPLILSERSIHSVRRSIFLGEKHRKRIYSNSQVILSSAETLFGNKNFVTLIGDAGSGKSTIVQYLFIKCVVNSFSKIPIKIELRYLNELKIDIKGYIINKILIERSIATNERIAIRLLQKGKFIFFFDGYDEIERDIKANCTNSMNSFMREFNNNFYLITSRPFTGIEYFPLCNNYYVNSFNIGQIKNFIRKLLPILKTEVVNKIIKEIEKESNIQYKSFLSNPLLLSMFILTFRHNSSIPQQKSIFYQQVFDALFFEHDSLLKLSFQRKKNSNLNKSNFEKVLMIFSFISFFEERFVFTTNYMNSTLDKVKKNLIDIEFDNQDYIDDLLISVAILQKDGIYHSFVHRSLQEFFAAKFTFQLQEEKKIILYDQLIKKYAIDDTTSVPIIVKINESLKNYCLLLKDFSHYEYSRLFIIPLILKIQEGLKYLISNKQIDYNIKLIESVIYEQLLEFEILTYLDKEKIQQTFKTIDSVKKEIETAKKSATNSIKSLSQQFTDQTNEIFCNGKKQVNDELEESYSKQALKLYNAINHDLETNLINLKIDLENEDKGVDNILDVIN